MALKCETNTQDVASEIMEHADASDALSHHDPIEPFFEHGQWWLECQKCGAQWGVVDVANAGLDGEGWFRLRADHRGRFLLREQDRLNLR